MPKLPEQVLIENTSTENERETISCDELLRSVNGKRQVYAGKWGSHAVVLKLFSDKFRARSHLKREWQALNYLREKGLSSPQPLFKGQTNDGRQAIVIEKIPEKLTVLEAVRKMEDRQKLFHLLQSVCEEVARQHNECVLQSDLHLGNFLVRDDEVFAVDAGTMKFLTRPVSKSAGISQLALLLHPYLEKEQPLREKLFKAYMKIRGFEVGRPEQRFFNKQLGVQKKRSIKRSLKKSLRTNKRHLRINEKGLSGIFAKKFLQAPQIYEFARNVDLLMDEGRILKNGNTCYLSRIQWGDRDLVVKRYNYKGFIHSIRHTIKGSRAKKCWLHGQRLRMLDIPTPEPLAYFEKRRWRSLWKSYLVTEYVPGQKLDDYLKSEQKNKNHTADIRRQLEALIEKMGRNRIVHTDLKHSNILITSKGPVITDLDAIKVQKWPGARKVGLPTI